MSSFINQRRANALPGLWHDYANLFPMLDAAGQDALRADVQQHGVREPVIQFEGRILDGRNRYMAARDLGLDFPVAEFDGTAAEALAYVLSTNLHRRHLTESQRGTVAAKLANMKRTDTLVQNRSANLPDGDAAVSQAQAAEMLNVSERTLRTAKKVIEQGAPELVAAVEQGDVSVSAAAEVSGLPQEEQAAAVAEGPDAVKAKAREVREARSTTSVGDAKHNTPQAEPVDPERRKLAKLTTDALIDEVLGLRADLTDEKAKSARLKKEREDLASKLSEALAGEQGRVIGNLQRQLDQLKGRIAEHQTAAKRWERKAVKAEARVKELENMEVVIA